MTGNLTMMMKFRDMQVAEDMEKKAALGWFDIEFTMYGCAYLEADKMYYKVSPQAKDIYDFIEKSAQKEIYPSNVMILTKECSVPIGMKELIAQKVKKTLAKKLKNTYPKAFFEMLDHLAKECRNNTAAKYLWQEAELLEGLFEEEKLKYFEVLVHYIYSCRKLTTEEYQKLLSWLNDERESMDDDFISKDIFEKTLYGIAYEEEGRITYLENAHSGYIYETLYAIEEKGLFVTPILEQTYWYNYEYCLIDVKKDFKVKLEKDYDKAYLERLKTLKKGPNNIINDEFETMTNMVKAKWGVKPAETLIRYGYRWGQH